jgi:pimeloyl-ACP methyl ester carboxylesterase
MRSHAPAGSGSVLLLHGAWHDAWCWKLVESRLSDAQIAWIAPDLPLANFATDMAAARLALKSCAPPVVVVGHSQGGWLAAHLASEGGPVGHAMYISSLLCGVVPPHRRFTPLRRRAVLEQSGSLVIDPAFAVSLLYEDCPPELAREAISHIRPSQKLRGMDPADAVLRARRVPSTYIVCTEDRCVHPEDQRRSARYATNVVEVTSGHSPMLSMPDRIAMLIVSLYSSALQSTAAAHTDPLRRTWEMDKSD